MHPVSPYHLANCGGGLVPGGMASSGTTLALPLAMISPHFPLDQVQHTLDGVDDIHYCRCHAMREMASMRRVRSLERFISQSTMSVVAPGPSPARALCRLPRQDDKIVLRCGSLKSIVLVRLAPPCVF